MAACSTPAQSAAEAGLGSSAAYLRPLPFTPWHTSSGDRVVSDLARFTCIAAQNAKKWTSEDIWSVGKQPIVAPLPPNGSRIVSRVLLLLRSARSTNDHGHSVDETMENIRRFAEAASGFPLSIVAGYASTGASSKSSGNAAFAAVLGGMTAGGFLIGLAADPAGSPGELPKHRDTVYPGQTQIQQHERRNVRF